MIEENLHEPPHAHALVSLEDLVLRHQEFLATSWKDRTPIDIAEKFKATYGWLPVIKMVLSADRLRCDVLHRARWVDPAKEDIADPQTYSYPRSPEKQTMGRANLYGTPVFYACGSADSSLAEARSSKEDGNVILMRSEWGFTDRDPWRIGGMIKHEDIMRQPGLRSEWEASLREYILKCDRIPQEYVLLSHDLIAELFLQEEYEVTSWIAHRIMQEQNVIDMLVYPSLRTRDDVLCHAFQVDGIDAGRVVLQRVEKAEMIGETYLPIGSGTVRNDRMEWDQYASNDPDIDRGDASTQCDVITSKRTNGSVLPSADGPSLPQIS